MNTRLSHLIALCLSTSALLAQQPAPAPEAAPKPEFKTIVSRLELKDGDTLVFLGDSITHQCLYTQYLEDYFYTRYPNLRIHFHNSGVGGDRAADALRRFEDDVASFKPKYVTILLGMNDGSYRDFDKAIFDTYQQGMTTLLDQIAALGATAIPMTPTMHDARAARLRGKPQEPRDTYYNGVLALYGAWLREQAQVRGLGFVDMYSQLNTLTLEARKTNATFTLIKDAVHPDAPGQVVMAIGILDSMVQKGPVSAITVAILPKTGKFGALPAVNGKITDFKEEGDTLSFNFQANALPWVLPPDAAEGYKLTHAGHRNSNEKITVRNLKPGKYALRIEGQAAGTYTDGQLAFGVELEENEKTPQYQQALKVALLNKDRNDQAVRPLRNFWGGLKGRRNALGKVPAAEKEAAQATFDKWVKDEFTPGIAKLKAQVLEFENKIYEANQIPARKYEITRVP
ncbi:MAG: SGNH/GDSL hydrolase family protein [Verrucomicrobiota bacterium]